MGNTRGVRRKRRDGGGPRVTRWGGGGVRTPEWGGDMEGNKMSYNILRFIILILFCFYLAAKAKAT